MKQESQQPRAGLAASETQTQSLNPGELLTFRGFSSSPFRTNSGISCCLSAKAPWERQHVISLVSHQPRVRGSARRHAALPAALTFFSNRAKPASAAALSLLSSSREELTGWKLFLKFSFCLFRLLAQRSMSLAI